MYGFPNLIARSFMEESRPFPRIGSPPDSNASSPTPSSLESYGERDIGVHPSEKIFNFPGSSNGETGGPVTLTGLHPISPTNEDIHSAEQYRNPLMQNIGRLNAGPPFFTYINPAQPLVADQDPEKKDSEKFSEKYNKMKQKTDKRKKRGEKNVITVMKAEDIDGHKTADSIETILESIGEQVDEEKRPKGKKFKEKLERPKSQKKDKRKSLEEVENSRGSDKEEENEEEQDAETGVTNFQENFYVLPSSIENKSPVEDQVSGSSPQSNFTKVRSKKRGGRRGRGEERESERMLPRSPDKDKDRSRERKDWQPPCTEEEPCVEEREESCQTSHREVFPRLLKDDFPALPGGNERTESVRLPGAWGKILTKASEVTPDNTEEKENQDSVPAVIVPEVPNDAGSSDSDNNNNNNYNCDEKVEVLRCPEEFEKKLATKETPVVIFSEQEKQDWTSSEFTFGFDVNEELIATAASRPDKEPVKIELPSQEIFMSFPTVAPIDSVDAAILDFGVAPAMRPLIVGVPVGVPVPASSFPLYSNHIVQPFPPFTGLAYPHLPDQDLKAEEQEPSAVSPESGISSSSPLSWQQTEGQPPLHSQVTESLNNWSGHLSEEETDQDSGLASCHSAKTESRFNFVEIVNFVSSSWSSVSEDHELQIFSS